MRWDQVQEQAKDLGYLKFAMDQGQTPVLTQPGPWGNAYNGFCSGCAVRWIALRYGGKDFAFNKITLEARMPDWRTTRDQNIHMDTPGSFPDDLGPVLAQYGLTFNQGRVKRFREAANGRMLRDFGSVHKGCYYIILRREGGAHAVAMQYLGDKGWRFFDANEGEFEADTDEQFEQFVDWYMQDTGYENKYTAATEIAAINPPPYVLSGFDSLIRTLGKVFGI